MKVATVQGVRIEFYPNDRPPPHFHAVTAEHRAVIDILTASVDRGELPRGKRRVILAWAQTHRSVLLDSWYAMRARRKPLKIT